MVNKKQSLRTSKKITEAQQKQVLFKFLKRTKNGKYAPIEKSSIPYSRIGEQTEVIEQIYYYGLD